MHIELKLKEFVEFSKTCLHQFETFAYYYFFSFTTAK